MAVLAGALAGLEKLHIGFNAAFLCVQLRMHQVLDQPVGAALERHVLGRNHIESRLVLVPERLRGRDVLGADVAGFAAGTGHVALIECFGHGASLLKDPWAA